MECLWAVGHHLIERLYLRSWTDASLWLLLFVCARFHWWDFFCCEHFISCKYKRYHGVNNRLQQKGNPRIQSQTLPNLQMCPDAMRGGKFGKSVCWESRSVSKMSTVVRIFLKKICSVCLDILTANANGCGRNAWKWLTNSGDFPGLAVLPSFCVR